MFYTCRCVCISLGSLFTCEKGLDPGGAGTREVALPSEMWLIWPGEEGLASAPLNSLLYFPSFCLSGFLVGKGWLESFQKPAQHKPWTEETPPPHPRGVSALSDLRSAAWPWAITPLASRVHRKNCRTGCLGGEMTHTCLTSA